GVGPHRSLTGADGLGVAWVGTARGDAGGPDGAVRALPDPGARRDGSGLPLDGPVASIGSPLA
ncbi:MAG: hypothetical protein ABWZ77_04705, partial [Naasia sp.]